MEAVIQFETLIRKGKGPARRLLKVHILLKADVAEAGPGWSDIVHDLPRARKQLWRGGSRWFLRRQQRNTPVVPRIFDGQREAELITQLI
jgi:hypothetical protein